MDEEQAWQSRSESLRLGLFPRASEGSLRVSAEVELGQSWACGDRGSGCDQMKETAGSHTTVPSFEPYKNAGFLESPVHPDLGPIPAQKLKQRAKQKQRDSAQTALRREAGPPRSFRHDKEEVGDKGTGAFSGKNKTRSTFITHTTGPAENREALPPASLESNKLPPVG